MTETVPETERGILDIDKFQSSKDAYTLFYKPRLLKIHRWCAENRDLGLASKDPRRGDLLAALKKDLGCPLRIQCARKKTSRSILQFHHLHKGAGKKFNIGSMYSKKRWFEVVDEVWKCDVMCGNCHTYLTQKLHPYLQRKKNENEVVIVTRLMSWKLARLCERDKAVESKWMGSSMQPIIPSGATLLIHPTQANDVEIGDIVWCSVKGYTYCNLVIEAKQVASGKASYRVADADGVVAGWTDKVFGKVVKINGVKVGQTA